jgi:methylated-DNA-[protein]-cysteine S-methyltransferase
MSITHDTPIGTLHLAATERGLTLCGWAEDGADAPGPASVLDHARRELDDYFAGTVREFSVPVDLGGVGDYRRRVLERLCLVGYGETTTYGALAADAGLPAEDARRVGGVMASNPVAIVVPCHRVIGSDGSLTGYAGGLDIKRTLLDLEARDRTPMLF